jgi:hypothetical protein
MTFEIPSEFPRAWFWKVGSLPGFWSSEIGAYVDELPEGWSLDGDGLRPTRIASEAELTDVLANYGMPGPMLTQSDYADAIQFHVDTTAKSRGYSDSVALASYVSSTVPGWAAEAQAFVAWRDAVWIHAHTELARVLAGERAQQSVAALVAELPAMIWPE